MEERIRILCVDDERNVLKALERVFLDEEYEIITAASAQEGLALLEGGEPVQVVISDYRMPVMSGVDFLREVYRRWPDTVRIVLSGYADAGAVVGAINEGNIYKFITKPWNDDELRVAIVNALERYFLKKSNRMLMEELQVKNRDLARVNRDLEGIVAERTAKIVFQDMVLGRTRNILEALPLGVIGIDADGMIVQVNELSIAMLGRQGEEFLGCGKRQALPEEVNEFLDALLQGGATAGTVLVNGRVLNVRVAIMKRPDQEGIIMVLDEEE
jgi:two-component system NtrC family sensor kinase